MYRPNYTKTVFGSYGFLVPVNRSLCISDNLSENIEYDSGIIYYTNTITGFPYECYISNSFLDKFILSDDEKIIEPMRYVIMLTFMLRYFDIKVDEKMVLSIEYIYRDYRKYISSHTFTFKDSNIKDFMVEIEPRPSDSDFSCNRPVRSIGPWINIYIISLMAAYWLGSNKSELDREYEDMENENCFIIATTILHPEFKKVIYDNFVSVKFLEYAESFSKDS